MDDSQATKMTFDASGFLKVAVQLYDEMESFGKLAGQVMERSPGATSLAMPIRVDAEHQAGKGHSAVLLGVLAIELALKALHIRHGIAYSKVGRTGHDLLALSDQLPESVRQSIELRFQAKWREASAVPRYTVREVCEKHRYALTWWRYPDSSRGLLHAHREIFALGDALIEEFRNS